MFRDAVRVVIESRKAQRRCCSATTYRMAIAARIISEEAGRNRASSGQPMAPAREVLISSLADLGGGDNGDETTNTASRGRDDAIGYIDKYI